MNSKRRGAELLLRGSGVWCWFPGNGWAAVAKGPRAPLPEGGEGSSIYHKREKYPPYFFFLDKGRNFSKEKIRI